MSPTLVCSTCGARRPLAPLLFGCPDCRQRGVAAALDVAYDVGAIGAGVVREALTGAAGSLWRLASVLPCTDASARTSLGEGRTPLVAGRNVIEASGLSQVRLKVEGVNPTGSFKDRLNAVAVSMARQFGFERVLCTTTGNHGVSLAAYASAAGLPCLVACTPNVEPVAVARMRRHGARVVVLDGSPADGRAWLGRMVTDEGWWPSTRNQPRPYANPFGVEGYKTIAFELWEQHGERVPDRVLVPVGGGDSIAGIAAGFRTLQALGLTDRMPQMIACQAEAAASLVDARRRGANTVAPVVVKPSVAISVAEDQTGDHGLRALGATGQAVAVAEDEIQRAVDLLGRDGLCVDPASAVSVAALLRLAAAREIAPDERVVCVLTGDGTRWSGAFSGLSSRPERLIPGGSPA